MDLRSIQAARKAEHAMHEARRELDAARMRYERAVDDYRRLAQPQPESARDWTR